MSREEEGEDDGVDKQGRLLLVPCMERCGVYCLSNKAPRYFFRVFYVVEYTISYKRSPNALNKLILLN